VGLAFQAARVGKLYCSTRCKQFGYNHKSEISEMLVARDRGINKKAIVFFIDDYAEFDRMQKMLKRFRQLRDKRKSWISADQEMTQREKLGLSISTYLFESYAKNKLSTDEEFEVYQLEMDLDERLLELVPKELSVEEWSFIKSLQPALDNIAFFEFVCSLSKQFLAQLSLTADDKEDYSDRTLIKHKFINHCNLIGEGTIRFEKRADEE
jgi:hypothetical protein